MACRLGNEGQFFFERSKAFQYCKHWKALMPIMFNRKERGVPYRFFLRW